MSEFQESRIEIRHFLMGFRNGYHYAKIQCPMCKIWIDGPVFIVEGQVHVLKMCIDQAREMAEIASVWQERLAEEAEIPVDKLHIHVQMIDPDLEPEWPVTERDCFTQCFLSGELVEEREKILHGEYDAVLIRLVPGERTPEELEELICQELVHVAFPKAGGKRNATMKNFFTDKKYEKWIEEKTTQLLKDYGYLFAPAHF